MTSTHAPGKPEHHRITYKTSDGLKLIAHAYGDPNATPVLLAHGGGQTKHAWGTVAQIMARQGWYAVALDLRGHGESDWSEGGEYGQHRFAEDLRHIAAGFKQRPAIIGASLGGVSAMVAEGLAEHRPVFSAIVLVDITPRVNHDGTDRVRGFMRAKMHEGFATVEEAADAISEYLPHRKRPKDLSGLQRNLRLGPDGRYRWHWDPKFIENVDIRQHDRDNTLEKAALNIKIPTLLVRGKLSELVDEEHVQHYKQVIPHGEFQDVSGAGHMVAGDQNDIFADRAIEFLNRVVKDAPKG